MIMIYRTSRNFWYNRYIAAK